MLPTASPAVSHHSMFSVTTTDSSAAVAVEPLDYEEYIHQRQIGGSERDPLGHLLDFPHDDIEVKVAPKKIRTMGHVLPEEPMGQVDPNVQNCVECYTSDYVIVRRKHQHLSSSVRTRDESEERLNIIDTTPAQEFEIDDSPDVSPEYDQVRLGHRNLYLMMTLFTLESL